MFVLLCDCSSKLVRIILYANCSCRWCSSDKDSEHTLGMYRSVLYLIALIAFYISYNVLYLVLYDYLLLLNILDDQYQV